MELPSGIKRLFRFPFRSRRATDDVLSELETHLRHTADDLVARGWDPAAARAEAERRFGSRDRVVQQVESIDRTRDGRLVRSDLLHDLRYALRRLRRAPGFTAVAILTIALGIGANVAIFTLLDGVILRPLPYHEPHRIVRLFEHDLGSGREYGNLTVADVHDWRDRATSLADVALLRYRTRSLHLGDGTVLLSAAQVSPGFFGVLGVPPAIGRSFAPEEGVDGAAPVVLLSHGLWQRLFGGDRGIVGRTVRINGVATTVIGVLPRSFHDPVGGRIEIWYPGDFAEFADDPTRARMMHFLQGFARLRDGVRLEDAHQELLSIGRQLETEYPESNLGHLPNLLPVNRADVRGVRPILLLTMAAAGTLLLLMAANLANLVLARSLSQQHETALRAALGAGRGRLARGVLLEQGVLVAAGAAVGLVAAWIATDLIADLVSGNFPRAGRIALDGRALTFGIGVAALTALLTGLVPALLALRLNHASALRSAGPGATVTRAGHRTRNLLVTVQVALTVLLAAGSGLVVRSLTERLAADIGFDASALTFATPLPASSYPDAEAIREFQGRLLERLTALPGVEAAGAAYAIPMTNASTIGFVPVAGAGPTPPPEVGYNAATSGYFRALGIPLLEGRLFDTQDGPDAPVAILVNQALADRFFPGESPVGRRVWTGTDADAAPLTIVGVIGNIRRSSIDDAPDPELYFSLGQDLTSSPEFAIRAGGNALALLPQVRRALAEIDPDVPLGTPRLLQDVVNQALVRPRFLTGFLSAFAGLALLLSGLGVHGVIAFLVAQRTRELGVRRALGATTATVAGDVLRRGLLPVGIGMSLGLIGALLLGPVLQSLLYGVGPRDPFTLGAVLVVTLAAAVLGCLAPTRRALRIDPMVALRE